MPSSLHRWRMYGASQFCGKTSACLGTMMHARKSRDTGCGVVVGSVDVAVDDVVLYVVGAVDVVCVVG